MTPFRLTLLSLAVCAILTNEVAGQTALSPPPHPENAAILRTWSPEYPPLPPGYAPGQRGPAIGAHADRLFAERPDAFETFEILIYVERPADALTVLGRLLDCRPDQVAAGFALLRRRPQIFMSPRPFIGGTYVDDVRTLVTAARQRLTTLPREAAAEAALSVRLAELAVGGTRDAAWVGPLEAFAREYQGTQAALMAEVEIITANRNIQAQIDSLDWFAREHPGTVAAARARWDIGWHLGHNALRRGQDPTDALTRVFDIVRDLRSGRYPPCEWVDKAPELGTGVFVSEPIYAPGNADRLLAAYDAFVTEYFDEAGFDSVDWGMGYVVATRMGDLFAMLGDRIGGIERTFAALERINLPRARFLRAHFYVKTAQAAEPAEHARLLSQARDTLASLRAADPRGLYGRKALAMLASIAFEEREYAVARNLFDEYMRTYPETEWAWVAALRRGRSDEILGNLDPAVTAYRTAAQAYATVPAARVLGDAYAGRVAEALGRLDEARDDYERALAGWPDRTPRFSLGERTGVDPRTGIVRDASDVVGEDLKTRISQLTRFASQPGGDLLERGRRLLEHGEHAAARALLEDATARVSDPPTLAEARFLLHRARIEQALVRAEAGVARPADEAAAIAEFDAIAADPYDFGVAAAKIAKASLLFRQGAKGAAGTLMTEALAEWRDRQAMDARPSGLPAEVERDVIDLRATLFRPSGDGVMSEARWEYRWPAAPRFVIASADVRLSRGGEEPTHVSVFQLFPAVPGALILTTDRIELLQLILTRVGGPVPRGAVTTDLATFWSSYVPVRRAFFMGAWQLATVPTIGGISFGNAERTRAAVAIAIGLEGATFNMEKEGGTWRLRDITNRSIQ